ncbi:ATPase, T2SS/T4P/T4SS family [Xenorhabdus budapestensis]|uniref:Type IV secretion system protein n=1 Tax=Xenorhabdus budapestensis TaxID=290110 RepID=A0A2D0ITG8_XENBU|nr:ATPase, T2SS/T4P/T4SS family [Xenorhabdus budapestensis]PHM25092.1 type IV secretion system protein [Xenorhabdus budapestensis]
MNTLRELSFIDLYIGEGFAEVKGLQGVAAFLTDLPDVYREDAGSLKNKCYEIYLSTHKTEFSLQYDTRLYRITVICNLFDGVSFVIRQTPASHVQFSDIPFTTHLRRSVVRSSATGLCLIAGEMGCGKTTTAASVLRHRIETTASFGVSIEDPIETLLNGRHGEGRCMQLEVGQDETYSSATKKAWRTGASCLLLGEIRDGQTAHEVLKASLTMFVVSTLHASSVFEAIERYVMFCEEVNPKARQHIANTLYIIAHQKMTPILREGVVIGRNIDINAYNLVNCTQNQAIKSKITQGSYQALADEFNAIAYTL